MGHLKIITTIVLTIYTLATPLVLMLVLMAGDDTFGPKSNAVQAGSYIVAGLVTVYTVAQWALLVRFKNNGSKLGMSILLALPIASMIIYIIWSGLTSNT